MISPTITTVKQICQYCFTFVSISLFVLTSQVVAQNGIQWEKDIDKAKAKAAAEQKPMLLHFFGDSCPPCQLMEREVFPNAGVINKLNSDFIAVKIDTSRSPQIMNQYGVRSIPTDIYLSPSGDKFFERSGRTSVSDFVTEMTFVAAKFRKPQPEQNSQISQIAQTQQSTQNLGIALAEYQQPAVPQAVNQGQSTGFSGFSTTEPVSQVPTFQPQVQSPSEDSEGFAVSGNSTGQQQNAEVPARWHPLEEASVAIADNQGVVRQAVGLPTTPSMPQVQFVPQATVEQQFSPTQPTPSIPLQQVAEQQYQQMPTQPSHELVSQNPLLVQEQPIPQYAAMAHNPLSQQSESLPIQSQWNQPTYIASSPSASPEVTVGTFDNGLVRKQPTAGLGGGNSLGVVATVNDKPLAVQQPNIALDGYCPVSLAQTAKWVKGNAEITTEYDGVVFRFASVEAQNFFIGNPALYAPVLRGNDAVELLTNRHEMAGHRKFGAWYHGHVFLFANAENYEKFQNNPELYAFQAQQSITTMTASAGPSR